MELMAKTCVSRNNLLYISKSIAEAVGLKASVALSSFSS